MQMNKVRSVLLIILLFTAMQGLQAFDLDSLRMETIDGQAYIIHQVDPGETLYSISKRYHCSMNSIAEASPEVKRGLENGMVIKVPYSPDNKPKPSGQSVHIVKQGETLYSISRIYDVSVIDIMEWNDLMSADLEIDQKLTIKGVAAQVEVEYVLDGMRIHVVQPGEGLYAIARQYEVSVDDLVEWNELTSSALNLGQEIIVGKVGEPTNQVTTTPAAVVESPESSTPNPEIVEEETVVDEGAALAEEATVSRNAAQPPVKMSQQRENGLAAAIEGGDDDKKFLAMHRSIPVGSLVAVRNEMNQQVVFVRIIGALPDTGVNNKIIIRLSAAAFEQLRAIDPRFRVEITYLVPEE
jgi:LysM repeat protein